MLEREFKSWFFSSLQEQYEQRELGNIYQLCLEEISGLNALQRLVLDFQSLSPEQLLLGQAYMRDLKEGKPVQQVLGFADFYGLRFTVNPHVLIPRPETEELVSWLLEYCRKENLTTVNILDIGTGSGCIPISLKRELPLARLTAIDISSEAIGLARDNAIALEANCHFLELDFLEESKWEELPIAEILISNPPYISRDESELMPDRVLRYEPHLALFPEHEDHLIFYRKLAAFAVHRKDEIKSVFLEINEHDGPQILEILNEAGLEAELRKDLQGRDRMIRANFETTLK